MVGVTGSIPVAPTNKRPGHQQLQRHSSGQPCLVMPEQAANGAQKPDRIGQTEGSMFTQGSSLRRLGRACQDGRGVSARRFYSPACAASFMIKGLEHQTTNLGVRSSNLFGRANNPLILIQNFCSIFSPLTLRPIEAAPGQHANEFAQNSDAARVPRGSWLSPCRHFFSRSNFRGDASSMRSARRALVRSVSD
jgi:hypothetical protein